MHYVNVCVYLFPYYTRKREKLFYQRKKPNFIFNHSLTTETPLKETMR